MLLESCLARRVALALAHLQQFSPAQGRRGLLHCVAVAGAFLVGSALAAALPQAAAPLFSVAAGSYPSAQSVTISDSTPGAVIYYTTNGTYPGTASAVYSTAIAVTSSEIVVAG
jgi:hypothetical protein